MIEVKVKELNKLLTFCKVTVSTCIIIFQNKITHPELNIKYLAND